MLTFAGNVYFADQGNGRARKIFLTLPTSIPTAMPTNIPTAIPSNIPTSIPRSYRLYYFFIIA